MHEVRFSKKNHRWPSGRRTHASAVGMAQGCSHRICFVLCPNKHTSITNIVVFLKNVGQNLDLQKKNLSPLVWLRVPQLKSASGPTMTPLKFDAEEYAAVMKRGSHEALNSVLRMIKVNESSVFELERLNFHSPAPISKEDILFPFFTSFMENQNWREDSLGEAYLCWRRDDVAGLKRVEMDARSVAFGLIVQMCGFSVHSFSPISRTEPQVLLPFFHVMIQQCEHINMEKAIMKQKKLTYESDVQRAFAWYHFDQMFKFYESKNIHVMKYL